MAQTDVEKLQAIILDVSRQNGSMAVQTLLYQMQRILQEDATTNLRGMRLYLRIIAQTARNIANDPEKWSHEGQYNDGLYQFNFARNENAIPEVMEDFRQMLNKLQIIYKADFQIKSAQGYLNNVATCALMIVDDINKHLSS